MDPYYRGLLALALCVSSVLTRCTYKIGVLERQQPQNGTLPEVILAEAFSDYTQYDIKFVTIPHPASSSYEAVQKVFEYLKKESVSVIAAPYHPSLSTAATHLQIPYLAMTLVNPEHRAESNCLVDLLPSFTDLALLVNHMAVQQGWGEIAIIYDGQLGTSLTRHATIPGLPLIETLVQDKRIKLNAWKVPEHANTTILRETLLDIRQALVRTLVLLCDCDLSEKILEQAAKYSMLSSVYNWFLPYLNPYCIDYTPIQFSGVNLTTLQIFSDQIMSDSPRNAQLFANATFNDAGRLLSRVLDGLFSSNRHCWVERNHFFETLKDVEFEGDTGHVEFGEEGRRTNYLVNLVSLSDDGWIPYATWNSTSNHHSHAPSMELADAAEISDEYPFGKKVVRVVTMLEPPFVQLRKDVKESQVASKNDLYEGYCVDLLIKLAAKHNFEYEIYLPPDGQWGDDMGNGSWSGLVGELVSHRADMAVSSLTITADREDVIDFSKPFKNRGISILMKKQKESTSFFQFLEPLDGLVWLMISVALVIVSLVLYFLDKIHQQELERRFDIQEAVWFSYGALVQSGTEVLPKTLSARILTSAWWFFSLILISSYTANLAAFLTVSKFNTPINDVSDLVGQSKVHYGTVGHTQVYKFFARSKVETFRKMGNYMSMINPESMVINTMEGVSRVRNSTGDYAFIWDSPVVKYQTIMDCDLIEVGRPFDSKGYGVGVPRGAPYRDIISMSILQLNEAGELTYLDKKWWAHSKCPADPSAVQAANQELTLDMVSGVFFLLAGGIAMALIVCGVQLLVRRRRENNKRKKTPDKQPRNNAPGFWNSAPHNNAVNDNTRV